MIEGIVCLTFICKLIMMQVTQRYFKGERYCEVDVDIGSSVIASQVGDMLLYTS